MTAGSGASIVDAMTTDGVSGLAKAASAFLIAGGVLMAGLWLVFTNVHGPTSINEDNAFLGGDMLFWGMLLGGIPNLLIAGGLLFPPVRVPLTTTRLTRVGYGLLLTGLIVPALIDLSIRALGAPLFVPIAALGLILLAAGIGRQPTLGRASRVLLLSIGISLALAFALALLGGVLEAVGGFRIFGIFGHLIPGIGWVMFGVSILRPRPGTPGEAG